MAVNALALVNVTLVVLVTRPRAVCVVALDNALANGLILDVAQVRVIALVNAASEPLNFLTVAENELTEVNVAVWLLVLLAIVALTLTTLVNEALATADFLAVPTIVAATDNALLGE